MSRIDELENEVAALQGRVSDLEHRLTLMERSHPPRAIPRPAPGGYAGEAAEGVRVTSVAPPLPDAPSIEEALRLVDLVTRKFPKVRFRSAEPDDNKFAAKVRNCMIGLSGLGRRDQPDTDKYPSYWVGEVEDVLRSCGQGTDIGEALLCAVIASGDITFAFAPFRSPAFGLMMPGGGRKAKPRWRDILHGVEPVPDAAGYPTDLATAG